MAGVYMKLRDFEIRAEMLKCHRMKQYMNCAWLSSNHLADSYQLTKRKSSGLFVFLSSIQPLNPKTLFVSLSVCHFDPSRHFLVNFLRIFLQQEWKRLTSSITLCLWQTAMSPSQDQTRCDGVSEQHEPRSSYWWAWHCLASP